MNIPEVEFDSDPFPEIELDIEAGARLEDCMHIMQKCFGAAGDEKYPEVFAALLKVRYASRRDALFLEQLQKIAEALISLANGKNG